jgi:prolyl oligopeptidase PreP (S9A serine peptidase family)
MNTNETKAKIWNMCIEKGIFNKVKGDDFKKIQDIFEIIVKGYEKVEPSTEVFNKVIDSISIEIQNQVQNEVSASFDSIEKQYKELLNTPIPSKIDFADIPQIQNQSQFQNHLQPQSQLKLEEIIMTQNKILIQILETQVKIIDILKK